MATIQQLTKGGRWRALYFDANGKRICRALKTKDKAIALKMAADLELAARAARSGTLTSDRGRALVNEMLVAAGQAPVDTETTRAFCERWMKDKAKNAAGTQRRYKRVRDVFLQSLGPVADRPLSAVQPRHIEEYRDRLTKAGLAPSSLKLDFKIIAGIFSKAVRQGMIAVSPCGAVEIDDAVGQTREPFSPADLEALLREAPPDWKTAILLGAYTGMRLGDAVNLGWVAVDLTANLITYTPQKTARKGRKLEVPIHPRLQAHLESIGTRGAAVCRKLAGQPTGGKTGLSRQFITIMEAAGIDRGATKTHKKQARAVSSKSFHSLRHYFNSELLRAGVDEKTRMDLSGHTTTAISRQYAHTDHATRKAAIEKL